MSPISKSWRVGDVLRDAAREYPDSRAIVHNGRAVTFRELDEAADRMASAYLDMGLKKGNRIAVLANNQPEWLYAFFGAARVGIVVVGISTRYRGKEFCDVVRSSRARMVISILQAGDLDYCGFLDSCRKKLDFSPEWVFIGKGGFETSRNFDDLLATAVNREAVEAAEAEVAPEDEVLILYTSGTTGSPKGAAITHKSVTAAARAQARHMRTNPDDLLTVVIPMAHVGGISCGVLTAFMGKAGVLLFESFEPGAMIADLTQQKPTVMLGFPTIHTLLMMHPDFYGLDTRGVRLVVTGGSAADPGLVKKLKASYPEAVVMNLYGLTESSGVVAMTSWNSSAEVVAGTIGKPVDDFRVQIVGLDDQPVPHGETGELLVKGGGVVPGYFRMPEESRNTITDSGWLRTGDMGFLDDHGRIVLKGRRTEMYIQEGYNVYPVEIEECLVSHPGVAIAAGIGIPDPVLGEVGRYYVVVDPSNPPSLDDLTEICELSLADYKRPRQIVLCDDLPMTATGKINKAKLRRDFHEKGH